MILADSHQAGFHGMTTEAETAAPARAVAKLASLEMRAIAFVLDLVILFICGSLFFALAGLILLASTNFGDSDPTDAAFNAFLVIWGSSGLVWALLEIIPTTLMGATLGKLIMGLKVVRRTGRPPALWRSAVRFLAYLIAPMLLTLAWLGGFLSDPSTRLIAVVAAVLIVVVGFGMVFFTRGRRALQDLLAGTYVIEARQYLPEEI
jgi:uncharacterized RDD family membrane protein YckC